MKIFGVRYFSIKAEETLFSLPNNIQSNQLFIFAISQRVQVEYYGKTYTIRLIEQYSNDKYLLGYLLKSSDLHSRIQVINATAEKKAPLPGSGPGA